MCDVVLVSTAVVVFTIVGGPEVKVLVELLVCDTLMAGSTVFDGSAMKITKHV